MNKTPLAILILALLPVSAQQQRPNLSGRWEAEKSSSPLTEIIDHKEPKIVITTVETGETLKLTTDGTENTNVVNGNVFRSKSEWVNGKLVTRVSGKGGLSLTEVRSLSKDGKTLTVETYMGEPGGEPQQKRVMVKR